MVSPTSLSVRLAILMAEHRALDQEITQISNHPPGNLILLQQKKRKKLAIKDEILHIKSLLLPDATA